MRDLLAVSDISHLDMSLIFENAQVLSIGKRFLRPINKIMGTLFLEPSTRTRLSFESAMKRLGGEVIQIDSPEGTSIEKGESFLDTIRTMGQYVDILVIRSGKIISDHPRSYVDCPVINAGDGAGQHPTQALTDLFTIWMKYPDLKGKKIAVTGDLLNGRAAHSVLEILENFTDFEIFVYSYTGMPSETVSPRLKVLDSIDELNELLPKLDILYMTRFQHERHMGMDSAKPIVTLTKERMSTMKSDAMIMHPLPRLGEIPREIDSDPRAVYFQQVKNGMWVRMAILHEILMDF